LEGVKKFSENKNRYGYSGIIVYETIVPDFYKKRFCMVKCRKKGEGYEF
jgi:hypothetical protein